LESKEYQQLVASRYLLMFRWPLHRERFGNFGVVGAPARPRPTQREAKMRLIILIILIILIVGAVPSWPYSTGWGYYPVGGLGTLLIIVLILALLGYV
jgi:Protein of unknown function (DUF3309)